MHVVKHASSTVGYHFRALRLLNRSSLLLGALSAAGLVLIANFQSIDNEDIEGFNNGTAASIDGAEVIHKFHWSGAFFTFVIGTAWMFVQESPISKLWGGNGPTNLRVRE